MRKSLKYLYFLLFFVNLTLIIYFWTAGSGELLTSSRSNLAIAAGRFSALLAVLAIMLQVISIGRVRWLEPVFGLDKLSRFHHYNGISLTFFLLAHPLLLAIGYSENLELSVPQQLLAFVDQYEDILGAIAGLFVFMFVVLYSVFIRRRRYNYEFWYLTHLLVYIGIGLAFGHQLKAGGDFLKNPAFRGYWLILYVVTFGNLLIFRFLRPLWLFLKHGFKVEKIVRETGSTVSIYIEGARMDEFKAKAGQFIIVRFLTKGLWWQAHPFSISMAPDGKRLRITVKAVGDFTAKVPDLPAGTEVIIDGPYGIFTAEAGVAKKTLMIAGGIGITPVRSVLEEFSRPLADVVLLYGNKTVDDVVFKEELENFSRKGVRVVHVLSEESGYMGEKGRIDSEKIRRLVPDVAEREVYLCGPGPMMTSVRVALQALGVPKASIHFEKFSL